MNFFIAVKIKVSISFYKCDDKILQINNNFGNCTLIFIHRNNGG